MDREARPMGGVAAKPLLRRLAGDATGPLPVWLMRQAGRYLPEYRALRARAGGFLAMCYDPAFAIEITLQPVRRFPLDAAILFSDILVVPDALGIPVRFVEGEGPRLEPVRDATAIERLDGSRLAEHLAPVLATLRGVKAALPAEVTLLGFAGAPFTLAAYVVEGQGSREFQVARTFARAQPALFGALVDRLTDATIDYLSLQVEAGAEAVQLFDSWAGVLAPAELERWSVAPTRRIVAQLRARFPDLPILIFPRGVGASLMRFTDLGATALALDTTVPMGWAVESLPRRLCLQGNLDPIALLGPRDVMLREAGDIVRAAAGRPHIFNLGHGVLPQTDPAQVEALLAHLKNPRT